MKDYHLHLVGLRTLLRVPHEITMTQRLSPFLCEGHDTVDCTITVQPLPPLNDNNVVYENVLAYASMFA